MLIHTTAEEAHGWDRGGGGCSWGPTLGVVPPTHGEQHSHRIPQRKSQISDHSSERPTFHQSVSLLKHDEFTDTLGHYIDTIPGGKREPLGGLFRDQSQPADGKLPRNRSIMAVATAGPEIQVKKRVFHLLGKKRPTERQGKTLSANKPSYLGGRKYLPYRSCSSRKRVLASFYTCQKEKTPPGPHV